jgi:hypothetical protein
MREVEAHVHVREHDQRPAAQFPNDKPDDDPQNLEDTDVQAQVTTSITPPTTPAPRHRRP